jgi:hypothetical protein
MGMDEQNNNQTPDQPQVIKPNDMPTEAPSSPEGQVAPPAPESAIQQPETTQPNSDQTGAQLQSPQNNETPNETTVPPAPVQTVATVPPEPQTPTSPVVTAPGATEATQQPAQDPAVATTPGTLAGPTPAGGTPQANPAMSQAAPTTPPQESPKKSKKKLILIAIPLLLAVTAIGAFLALKVFSSETVNLTTYDGEDFSISYPEGYEIEESAQSVKFDEPLEDGESEDQQSFVAVYYAEIPSSISDAQRDQLKQSYGSLAESFQDSLGEDGDNEVKDIKETKTTLKGEEADRLEGVIFEKGEKSGNIVFVSLLNDNEFVLVAVAGHVSDPGVTAKANDIIASFKTN